MLQTITTSRMSLKRCSITECWHYIVQFQRIHAIIPASNWKWGKGNMEGLGKFTLTSRWLLCRSECRKHMASVRRWLSWQINLEKEGRICYCINLLIAHLRDFVASWTSDGLPSSYSFNKRFLASREYAFRWRIAMKRYGVSAPIQLWKEETRVRVMVLTGITDSL